MSDKPEKWIKVTTEDTIINTRYVDALERDAVRYRWGIEHPDEFCAAVYRAYIARDNSPGLNQKEMCDAAIDAAMGKP
jgi:hypothetical protein